MDTISTSDLIEIQDRRRIRELARAYGGSEALIEIERREAKAERELRELEWDSYQRKVKWLIASMLAVIAFLLAVLVSSLV
jgi:hypothetical protein